MTQPAHLSVDVNEVTRRLSVEAAATLQRAVVAEALVDALQAQLTEARAEIARLLDDTPSKP